MQGSILPCIKYNLFSKGKRKERFEIILEPLQAMIQISFLGFYPIGSKLNIHNNLLYIQAARACLRDEIEECMINKEKKSHKCGCGSTKDTQGYCDGSHEEEEL